LDAMQAACMLMCSGRQTGSLPAHSAVTYSVPLATRVEAKAQRSYNYQGARQAVG
jgi:hypothetical protein